ncbi:MAG: NADH-quinone oxidoreductase subunit F [Actinomycetota bacterium]|nr:NADH-quinone oxidoreductase subunit F [Actinomycetota bacterium]
MVTARLDRPGSYTFDTAVQTGVYQALQTAVRTLAPGDVIEEARRSGLTGRSGGAAFLTAEKWVRLGPARPAYVVVNGDESEPGTFKDHLLLQGDPHQLIEGALICAYAVGAQTVVIYIRGEIALAIERVTVAVDDAYRHGRTGASIVGSDFSCDVIVHPGAGAYVVGEETALLESLEGKRGFPRIKPPWYPAAAGYLGAPTIVNNVETLSTLPWIITHGGAAFAALGAGRSLGTRLFSLSGAVRRPGVYEVELHHTTFRDLIFDPSLGGGLRPGRRLRAILPGASFPWLSAQQVDLPLDVDAVVAHRSSLGSGIMIVDDSACPVRLAWRLVRFFHRESCGQCTPCREGAGWLKKVMRRVVDGHGQPRDLNLLRDVGDNISPGPFPRPP